MGGQFGVHVRAELRVDGRQHLGELFHLGDRQPADGQGVGHFQADVAAADDDRAGRCGGFQGVHHGEGVAHRVQQVHAIGGAQGIRTGQSAYRGPDRDGAGADDELVVGEQVLFAVGADDQQLAASHVDPAGGGVQPQPHPGRLQVGDRAVGQVAPVRDLAGQVVGDAADREIRVGVRHHDRDLGAGVELAGPQRGADPRVAAADHHQVHGRLLGLASRWAGWAGWPGAGAVPSWAARAVAGPAWSCWWGTMMSAAWAGVMCGYSALMTTRASTPPRIWAAMNDGAEAGAIPAKLSENIRPTVIAGLAKLVEEVKKYAAPI